jgi:hypothetical protein
MYWHSRYILVASVGRARKVSRRWMEFLVYEPQFTGSLLPRREIAWLVADPKRAERQPRLKTDSQRASIFSPQAKMIIVALPNQTIAWAATGAPMQLAYNQKTPTEPRTSATPRNKRNEK